MKKIVLTLALALLALTGFSQAKKPTIMVVPSDVWCNMNGYMVEFDNQGAWEKLPDYNAALQSDPDLLLAISKLGEMMAERGFPLKDLGACLRQLRNDAAEMSVTMASDGSDVAESPVDKLKNVAKADIWMQLTYKVNEAGPKRSLTFNLQGIDAYSSKQIAAASGTGTPSFSVELPVLIEESILSNIDNFNNQLQNHFDDMFANGREVALTLRKWNSSPVDFETEFGGDELSFQIEDWMANHTVNGRFSTQDVSENRMIFEQVRIPLYAPNGRAIDTRTWANDLRKELQDKYNIDAKLSMKGLGQAVITIGAK
ncbi:MAG: DUF6175 family protein [Rikenellaceae bacterium]|jgi:hypothetical protein|nr:DUF6175 family protein [Rikenellaceae bacterium]